MNDIDQPIPAADQASSSQDGEGSFDAEYALEVAAVCPHCKSGIESVHVVRSLRVKVNFVSTLPRRGHVMVCPRCRSILGGAVGGII